jgi:hypothetical protein
MALRSSYLSVDYSWGQLRGGQSGVKSLTSASPAIRPSELALEQAVRHVRLEPGTQTPPPAAES